MTITPQHQSTTEREKRAVEVRTMLLQLIGVGVTSGLPLEAVGELVAAAGARAIDLSLGSKAAAVFLRKLADDVEANARAERKH